jgi:cytidylate kinase
METAASLDRCRSFIECQLKPGGRTVPAAPQQKLAVTISRQTGCGAQLVAAKLAELLQARAPVPPCQWTVFDRNLVEKVLDDHNLPKKLAQFMPEDRVSVIDDIMAEVLGLHPPTWTLFHQTAETILKLAELGNVILVGRGANVITSKLEHMFHARIVGSLEKRVERVRQHYGLGEKAAREFIEKEDRGRQRYFQTHFGVNIEDPLLYHLVLNTDRIPCAAAAELIAEAALRTRRATG